MSKRTDTTIIAVHQTSNKTETTQVNNHVNIVTEQIASRRIVKPVSTAEDWEICLGNVEHLDKCRKIDNKNRMSIKTREITIKTATQIPPSSKILHTRPVYVPGSTRRQH